MTVSFKKNTPAIATYHSEKMHHLQKNRIWNLIIPINYQIINDFLKSRVDKLKSLNILLKL